jgi:hypothetical protein
VVTSLGLLIDQNSVYFSTSWPNRHAADEQSASHSLKLPRGGAGHYDRFCRWLDAQYKKGWVQYALAPALVAVPPWVVNKLLDSPGAKIWLRSTLPFFADALERYDVLFYGLAAAYSWAILAFAKSVAKRVESRSLDIQSLLTLIAAIDNVVGCKLERFTKHVKSGDAGLTAESAFDAITQPRLQIAELVRGIADYFNACRPPKKNHLIRVVLAEMQGGKICDIPVFYPMDEPIRSALADLNKPNSAIMTAYRTRRTVVVESIEKKLRKGRGASYVDTGNPEDAKGSIICFPVISHSKQIPFVISIHCEDDAYFKKALTELYEHSLERFALRLNLEHSLLQLKEKLCGPKEAGP